MKTKGVGIVSAAVAILLVSMSAFASNEAHIASGPGPGGGEGGTPVGGGSCYYAYSIQKIGPTVAKIGEDITYFVFVQNVGTCRLRHIDVSDVLPEGVRFLSALPAPTSHHDDRLRWEDLELKTGRYAVFQIYAKVEEHHHNASFTNNACAFTPWIGTRICDGVTTRIDWDHLVE